MTKTTALRHLDLLINKTRREFIMKFRILSRSYHPEKWHSSKSFSKEEGIERFKIIANARDYLLDCI